MPSEDNNYFSMPQPEDTPEGQGLKRVSHRIAVLSLLRNIQFYFALTYG